MILTLTIAHMPVTDFSCLLHTSPANAQSFDLLFGAAHVFYPEATAQRCTAALLLDVGPKLIDDDRLRGYVVGLSDAWVPLHFVESSMLMLDGYKTIHLSNVSHFSVDDSIWMSATLTHYHEALAFMDTRRHWRHLI